MFRRERPEPQIDRRLDPYRRAAAHVRYGEEVVGVLVIRVVTWWMLEGPFWRRRWVDPRELPEWVLVPVGPPEAGPGPEDGVIPVDALDEELRDWSAGVFQLRGQVLRLDWCDQDEADALHRMYGWTDG